MSKGPWKKPKEERVGQVHPVLLNPDAPIMSDEKRKDIERRKKEVEREMDRLFIANRRQKNLEAIDELQGTVPLDQNLVEVSEQIADTEEPQMPNTPIVAIEDKETTELYKAFLKDQCLFAEFFLPSTVNAQSPDFHKEIYELMSTENRIALAAPRGFAKSTIIAKIYPLHAALFKKHRDICIISASEGLASEHLRFIKQEIEGNVKIKSFWGSLVSDKWTETLLVVKHPDGFTTTIRAKGAGGQIRGFRPDCIILDDIETDESVENEDQRKKLKSWIFKACLNTLLPGGKFVFIGTIIHPLSVLSDILAVDNGWSKRKYKAYMGGYERAGDELWPQMWPHDKLQERKKEIGSWAFASEYMNDPIADGTRAIRDDHIRYWKEMPRQYSAVIAIDPAYSEDENADWKVAVLVAIDQNMNRYLLDYVRCHDPSGEFIDQIINLWQRNKGYITAVGCPSGGGDKEFWNSLQKQADHRRIAWPLVELKNVFKSATGQDIRNKKERCIAALQPLFEKGMYYIGPNHLEARDEILTLGSSKHDDLVDALTYCENILTPVYYDTKLDMQSEIPNQAGKSTNYGMDD